MSLSCRIVGVGYCCKQQAGKALVSRAHGKLAHDVVQL
jgi:hypothetical protein